MQASGHASVQMHKRYIDLQRSHIAKAFGLENGNTNGRQESSEHKSSASQIAEFTNGEGRCPVVPLVFKTSLGAVRFPEGSTPSLLRQTAAQSKLTTYPVKL